MPIACTEIAGGKTGDGGDGPPGRVAHLCARLARLLLANGADGDFALRRVAAAGRALGYEVHVHLGDGAVTVTAGPPDRSATRVSRALPALSADMRRLAAIEAAIVAIDRSSGTGDALDARLDAVEAMAPAHGTAATAIGVAVTAASLARLFGADWPVVGVALLAGLASTLLRRRLAAASVGAIAASFLVALGSGLVAAAAMRGFPGRSPVLALTAAGMILVPGVPLINGVRDLVEGHAALAVTRLTTAAATVVAIGFALFLAAGALGDVLPVGQGPGRLPVPADMLFSATVVIGYAMLFDLPWRAVPAAMLCGVLSHATRTALAWGGLDLVTGSLVGALLAGVAARAMGRAYRVPAVTFAFPGTVAMIPGSYGFRAAIGGFHLMTLGPVAPAALVSDTIALAITTAAMTIAIAVGLCIAFALPFPRKDIAA